MPKANGKPEVEPRELDVEHELPPAEEDGFVEKPQQSEAAPAAPPVEQELARITAERDALLDRLARQQAEFENARKRALREQGEHREYAVADAVRSLLPVLDSLERALNTAAGPEDLRSGVELIRRQFEDTLVKLGLRAVPAVGEPFDPRLHQAVEMVDREDVPDHQVIEELQRGYKLKDRLLRPAMVRVARNPKK
ncbi:MAG TPA: nucleotide exchange factor GrpE [Terriglobales bacterium]|nr:nucleotide exchange factor GrpE [Terriglobales bacterium]